MREGHAILAVASALCALALHGAEAPIEFSGVLTTNGKPKVALTDKTSKATHWLEPGQDFLGYEVARYDEKQEAVFLKKGLEEIRLSLVLPKTPDDARGKTAAANANTSAADAVTSTAIRGNLRQFIAAARRFQTERGTSHVSFADIVGPDKYIKELPSVAGENYSTLTFAPNVTALSVTTSSGSTVTMDATAPTTATSAIAASPITPAPPPAGAIAAPPPIGTTPAATNASSAPVAALGGTPPPINAAPAAPVAANTAAPNPNAASPPPPQAIPDAGEALSPTGSRYTTRSGDTYESVARANGMTVEQLRALNPTVNVTTGSSLPPNQTIRIR
jgi:LysM repeat protein